MKCDGIEANDFLPYNQQLQLGGRFTVESMIGAPELGLNQQEIKRRLTEFGPIEI
jgi:hypothetical protein